MPDAIPVPPRLRPPPLVAAAQTYTPTEYRASAFQRGPWQNEGWYFYDLLGEFAQAVDWQARGMSRVRLVAAEIMPTGPQVIQEGPAADLIAQFCGGTPGQSQFMQAIVPHLVVPGEGWLIAERANPMLPLAMADWVVYPYDGVDARGQSYWVQDGPAQWRPLAPEHLPMRIYNPHPRQRWLARSSAQAAIPIMRRIELIDKRIIAMMVSRLAMNGLLLIPSDGIIEVPPPFSEAPDPFVSYLIDIASKNIAEPGRASAGIPIPIKFTGSMIEQWKILKPEDPLDEWLLKERDDELGRLGDTLSISRERVTGGTGEVNHWGAWQLSEEEIRFTFGPLAETITQAVTKAYLLPALMIVGEPLTGPNGGVVCCWYDASELAVRPDLSTPAKEAYDRGEITGEAYRRYSGLKESDALTDPDEIAAWVWRKVITDPNLAATAVAKLTGLTVAAPIAPAAGAGGAAVGPVAPTPATGAPTTLGDAPPPPGPPPVAVAATYRQPNGVNGRRAG